MLSAVHQSVLRRAPTVLEQSLREQYFRDGYLGVSGLVLCVATGLWFAAKVKYQE